MGTPHLKTHEVPLVSFIMPTRNRRSFVSQSISYFLKQDYPNKELVIIDYGEDNVADLIHNDEKIRYDHLDHRLLLEAKRDLCCETSCSGRRYYGDANLRDRLASAGHECCYGNGWYPTAARRLAHWQSLEAHH